MGPPGGLLGVSWGLLGAPWEPLGSPSDSPAAPSRAPVVPKLNQVRKSSNLYVLFVYFTCSARFVGTGLLVFYGVIAVVRIFSE